MKSLEDIGKIREEMRARVSLRNDRKTGSAGKHIMVCGGTGCTASDSPKLIAEFRKELSATGLDKETLVVQTGCFGLCALGPIVIVYPEGTFYSRVCIEDVKEIVTEHIANGRLVERLLYMEPGKTEHTESLDDTMFYSKQKRIALRNCGLIDPEEIDEYIAYDGYMALAKCLTEKKPEEIIGIVSASGRRGFSDRNKMEIYGGVERPDKICVLQRRRGRPRSFYGQIRS